MMRNLSTVSGTRAIFTTFTVTYEEYKKTLIDVIDDLTKYSYIEKLKLTVLVTGQNLKLPLE